MRAGVVGVRLVMCIAVTAIVVAAGPGASAATYLVRPDGTGDFPTMAAAIEAVQDGDVIELGDGVFRGPGNRDLTLSKLITLRSQSGDPNTCLIDCEGEPAQSHSWLWVQSNSLIEGVTVSGGYSEYGSGAIAVSSDGTVRNCVFRGNASPWLGGAAFCQCEATFDHCWFTGNLGGAAVRVGQESSPRFQSCYFVNNEGIACFSESAAEFVDCVFSGGALGGHCALAAFFEDVLVARCTVVGFAPSPGDGATILVHEGGHIRIENTIVAFNRGAATLYCAGAITMLCSDVHGNEGGDWVGCIEGQLGQDGNICLDPQFCSEDPGSDENWQIQSDSPCAPAQSACGRIGAVDVGCGSTPAEQCTWGGVKLLFTR